MVSWSGVKRRGERMNAAWSWAPGFRPPSAQYKPTSSRKKLKAHLSGATSAGRPAAASPPPASRHISGLALIYSPAPGPALNPRAPGRLALPDGKPQARGHARTVMWLRRQADPLPVFPSTAIVASKAALGETKVVESASVPLLLPSR